MSFCELLKPHSKETFFVKLIKRSRWLCAALPLGLVLNAVTLPVSADEPAAPATLPAAAAANQPQEFPQGMLFPYYLLDRVLDGKVDKDGHVNYVAMQNDKDGKRSMDYFMQAIASADLTRFPVLPTKTIVKDKLGRDVEVMSEDHAPELVFWINAYNAHVLSAVLAAYPIGSPDDIKDFDMAKTRRIGGKSYSFAELRKKIVALDPRAFFALSDGTLGGPILRAQAYRYTDINESLDQAVQYYISNPNQVQLLQLEKKTTVNPLLQQADELFAPKAARRKWEGIRKLLATYSIIGSSQHFYINNPDMEIAFSRPNRSVNKDPNASPVAAQQ